MLMSVRDITADTVLAAIADGCSTRDDLAQRFGVLSSSKWLTDALNELGAVEDEHGRLTAEGQQLAIDVCPGCGHERSTADDQRHGDNVCPTCPPAFEEILR